MTKSVSKRAVWICKTQYDSQRKNPPSSNFKPNIFPPLLLRHLDHITFWVTYIGVKHMVYLYSGEATYTPSELGQPICNTFSVLFLSQQCRRLKCHHICFSPGIAEDDAIAQSMWRTVQLASPKFVAFFVSATHAIKPSTISCIQTRCWLR